MTKGADTEAIRIDPAGEGVPALDQSTGMPGGSTGSGGFDFKALLLLGRPIQWTKNLVVFAALIFSGRLGDPTGITSSLLAFAAFCCVSSGIYAFNDILDAEEDRLHPTKRRRPIASGRTPIMAAGLFSGAMTALGLAIAFYTALATGIVCTTYILINIAYGRWLKHVVILDVLLVGSGFVLRAVAGAAAMGVGVSPWLLVCTILLSLFLAMCKRRWELVAMQAGAGAHRKVLTSYNLPLLDQMISSTTAAAIMGYCMYTFSSPIGHRTPYLMLTIPFVVYGIFRYLFLVYTAGKGGEPEKVLITDRPLQLALILWVLACAGILYGVRAWS